MDKHSPSAKLLGTALLGVASLAFTARDAKAQYGYAGSRLDVVCQGYGDVGPYFGGPISPGCWTVPVGVYGFGWDRWGHRYGYEGYRHEGYRREDYRQFDHGYNHQNHGVGGTYSQPYTHGSYGAPNANHDAGHFSPVAPYGGAGGPHYAAPNYAAPHYSAQPPIPRGSAAPPAGAGVGHAFGGRGGGGGFGGGHGGGGRPHR